MGSVFTLALKMNSTQNLQHRSECGHIRRHIDHTLQTDCVCLRVEKKNRESDREPGSALRPDTAGKIEISKYARGERRQVGPTPSPTVGACAGYR